MPHRCCCCYCLAVPCPTANAAVLPWDWSIRVDDVQLEAKDLEPILLKLGRPAPAYPNPEDLYVEEDYDPRVKFTAGDYVLMDVDRSTGCFAFDDAGRPLVRTMRGSVFEATFNRIDA